MPAPAATRNVTIAARIEKSAKSPICSMRSSGIHLRVMRDVEQGLGAHVQVRIVEGLLHSSCAPVSATFVQHPNRLAPDLGIGMRQQAADGGMGGVGVPAPSTRSA